LQCNSALELGVVTVVQMPLGRWLAVDSGDPVESVGWWILCCIFGFLAEVAARSDVVGMNGRCEVISSVKERKDQLCRKERTPGREMREW
jgi:hypothetical protein